MDFFQRPINQKWLKRIDIHFMQPFGTIACSSKYLKRNIVQVEASKRRRLDDKLRRYFLL